MLDHIILINDNPARIGHASSYKRGPDVVAYIDRRRKRMIAPVSACGETYGLN